MSILTKHQSAALNYKEHISLTANAGSGKTFVLSKRYVEIALNEDIHLRNIAAITFTDKAAGELYNKIAVEIDRRYNSTDDNRKKKKLIQIRRELVSANISTIHSFCIDILREFPVECNIDANFTPIDTQLSNELIELSVEETIKELLYRQKDSEQLKNLIRIFASKRILASELIDLIHKRKNVLTIEERYYTKSKEEISGMFYNSFLRYLKVILFKEKNIFISALKKINDDVLTNDNQNEIAKYIQAIIPLLNKDDLPETYLSKLKSIENILLTSSGTVRKQGYVPQKTQLIYPKEIGIIQKYFNDVKDIEINENHEKIEIALAEFGLNLLTLFNKTLNRYENKKKQNSYLDFEDILLLTKKVLLQDEVRSALSEKYLYLMIDEYQDTNEIQYEIFLPILDHLRLNNLFIVGDEKQSIYMFRDAELEVFERTKDDIAKAGSSNNLLNLPDSFRMAPAVCLFTNYLFEKLFDNPEPLFNEVKHNDLVYARNDEVHGSVKILLATTGDKNDDKTGNEEAALVANKILSIKKNNHKYEWKDIAILCRKRSVFIELENEFLKKNIPFSILGGKGFYQRQVIYDIFNYMSFLLNNNNDAALTGILRSPFFSISDGEIYELSLEKGNTFLEKINYAKNKNNKFKRAVIQLEENIKLANKQPVITIVRKIFRETPYLSVIAARVNGEQELANIDKLLKMTIAFISQGFKTLFDYVYYLRDAINKTEDEGQAAPGDDIDSVKIMTIHQAKGLEYSVVILFHANETSMKDSVKSKQITISKDFGILAKLPLNNDYFSEYQSAPIISVYNYLSKKKAAAELKRLFYVAVTRAKDQLIISASHKKFNFSPDSFMGMLCEGLEIDLDVVNFTFKHNLKYLIKDSTGYSNKEVEHALTIPIISEIEDSELLNENEKDIFIEKKIVTETITDIPQCEMISATKIAVYNQCPMKHKLTYDFGFSEIYKDYKKHIIVSSRKNNITDFDFNKKEEDELNKLSESSEYYEVSRFAEIKGSIIHEILQFNVGFDNLDDYLTESIKNKIPINEYDEITAKKIAGEIRNEIIYFKKSNIYKEIISYKNYKNEQQFYVKKNDYFLFGIIDKLIIKENEYLIIDYKTDNINQKEIKKRAEEYLLQLKFYALIVSKYYPSYNKIKIIIIFTKHPDECQEFMLTTGELDSFELEIDGMVKEMRKTGTEKNLKHCAVCTYSTDKKNCIVP